jgi:UPF0716 protein FxsA
MILLVLFASLIGVTLIEIFVVIKVGEAIGVLPTIALMLLDAAIGAALMRSQGRMVWRHVREALAAGRIPGPEALDGALVIAGGAFLITPGFVTDIFGLLLLIPPSRALARRVIIRRMRGRMIDGSGGLPGAGYRTGTGQSARGAGRAARERPFAAGRRPQTGDYDVDGTAVEIDHSELRPSSRAREGEPE